MKFEKYISRASNVFAQNKLLKLVLIVLAILVIFSQIKIGNLALNQKVVLIPVNLSEKAEVGTSSADETYLSAMGVYVATLLYSTNAATVESQYVILTKLFTATAYTKYSESILNTASTHAKNMISLNSKIEKVTVELKPLKVITVSVNVDKYVFGQKTEAGSKITNLLIGYEIIGGQFYITSLEEKI